MYFKSYLVHSTGWWGVLYSCIEPNMQGLKAFIRLDYLSKKILSFYINDIRGMLPSQDIYKIVYE